MSYFVIWIGVAGRTHGRVAELKVVRHDLVSRQLLQLHVCAERVYEKGQLDKEQLREIAKVERCLIVTRMDSSIGDTAGQPN